MAGDPGAASLVCPTCGVRNAPDAAACVSCRGSLVAASRLQPGSVIGRRYEVLHVLGAGGMGTVHKAYDRELEEMVAIKVLRADLARSEDMARRFRTEIKLARRVRHRNVCGIHEYGSEGGINYIAMELIEGTDLKRLIKQTGALGAAEGFDICIQIAEGLQAIHDAGIIHRDLKTSNAMLDPKGRVALMDFGIAKDTQQGMMDATAIGQIMGTPEYMSPEQARGEKIDARSDLYALGIIIFEIFSGHVPFQGPTPIATLFKTLEEPPPLEGELAAGIPRSVMPLLAKALAKFPAERYQSAREMAEALRRAKAEALPSHTPPPLPPGFDLASGGTISDQEPPKGDRTTLTSARTVVPPPPPAPPARAYPPTVIPPAQPAAPPPPPPPPPQQRIPAAPARPVTPRAPRPGVSRSATVATVVVGVLLLVALVSVIWWIVSRLAPISSGTIVQSSPTPVALPSPLPSPTYAPLTWPTPTPLPSTQPTPTSEPTPTSLPTPTSVPTPTSFPTPTAAPTPTSLPTAIPTREPTPRPSVSFVPLQSLSSPTPPPTAFGTVQVRVRPWAQVSVDNAVAGTTPIAPLHLKAGPHSLEFVHPDYKPVRRKVTVGAGETLRIELDMALDAVPK